MTASVPRPTHPGAMTATRAPWYVWGLVGFATMAAGPVVGGGFDHPTLLVGGGVVFLVGAITATLLTRLTPVTVWFCLVLVVLACGIAVLDVAATHTVLTTPIVSLMVTAVLALLAAIASIRRLSRV